MNAPIRHAAETAPWLAASDNPFDPDYRPGGNRPGSVVEEALPEAEEEEDVSCGEGWVVVLYNDEKSDMLTVVLALHMATGFELEHCNDIMMSAHNNGKAVVTITDKREAEKIVSVLRAFKLTAELREA